ncbi:IclR family transcriptional regulator [Bradyrhizobium mercantei]|uniref:IclR family transcriptional regulator n=1 Tax=Bradyrhizobium mercantei TaxID=1904807 RepID=UPI0009757156|nr:helix-turn-helix domain-containing protein [Bradyrhizobium mercantei]
MSNALIKSARRVFDILELFQRLQKPLRLTDVVEELGLPNSSAAALLKTMADLSYLSFDPELRTYIPTERIIRLGSWLTSNEFERGPIRAALHLLSRKSNEAVLLGTPIDLHAEVVDIIHSNQPIQYFTPVGAKVLLVHSALGWAFLSLQSSARIAKLHARTIERNPAAREIGSLDQLQRDVAKVRKDGYCFSKGMVYGQAGVVAMVMPSPSGHRPLAIAIGGPLVRIEKRLPELVAMLRAERAKLEGSLDQRGK